jgi:hypothetical protein
LLSTALSAISFPNEYLSARRLRKTAANVYVTDRVILLDVMMTRATAHPIAIAPASPIMTFARASGTIVTASNIIAPRIRDVWNIGRMASNVRIAKPCERPGRRSRRLKTLDDAAIIVMYR